jgi:hypothetical protein
MLGGAAAAVGVLALPMVMPTASAEEITLPPVSIGAGMQTSYVHTDPDTGAGTDDFTLNSIRLYLNGSVTEQIKLTFDTEYTGPANTVQVLDAIARFEFSDGFNIWAGRFLPPSDRANLYGPYYANDFTNTYADGVADYYPSVAVGRDNGVAYWGQFGIVKVSLGVFDGASLGTSVSNPNRLLTAGRIQVDLWDPEGGYYLNGTYYGEKSLLAFGVAAQSQDSTTSYSVDGLLEKPLGGAGTITVEAEYQKDDGLLAKSDGWYGLGAYLFPAQVGIGKFQVLGKYSEKTYDGTVDVKVKTSEFDLNYVMKAFKARVGAFYLNVDAPAAAGGKQYGVKLQLQF